MYIGLLNIRLIDLRVHRAYRLASLAILSHKDRGYTEIIDDKNIFKENFYHQIVIPLIMNTNYVKYCLKGCTIFHNLKVSLGDRVQQRSVFELFFYKTMQFRSLLRQTKRRLPPESVLLAEKNEIEVKRLNS